MKIKLLIYALVGLVLIGCDNDDTNTIDTEEQEESGLEAEDSIVPETRVETEAEEETEIEEEKPLDLNKEIVKVSGDIIEDTSFTKDKTYLLTGALAVKNGVTLTIDAGTMIKAVAGGSSVYIVVEPGAKIEANGTAEEPIYFTSDAENPSAGDWGGLLLVGTAPISGGGTSTTEVLPLQYGGSDSEDNSGILNYVIVEYTGARIGGESEFNGVAFYGVGNKTEVRNLAVLNGDDDAIEFFGGTVNVENVLIANHKDDMLDWTQGWTGTAKNIYGILSPKHIKSTDDPRGIEGDGNLDGKSPADTGQSNPTIDGITLVNNSSVEMSDFIKVRRGSNANISNVYLEVGESSAVADLIDLEDTRGNAVSGVSITGIASSANGLDITDIKNAPGATITISEGNTPSVDKALFDWTGFDF